MRFDCTCQKGHRFVAFGGTAPTRCSTTRWEAGVGSTVHEDGLGRRVVENPVPVACGALVDAAAVQPTEVPVEQKLDNPTVADLIAVLATLTPELKVRLIDSDWGENALEMVTVRPDGVVLLHF